MLTNRDNLPSKTPDPQPKIASSLTAVALAAAHGRSDYEDPIGQTPASLRKIAYSVAEAAYMSGLSRSSLYVAIRRGALRVKKCGRRTLILHEYLVDFLRLL